MFGLRFSTLTEQGVAERVATTHRTAAQGVGAVITPNIQHISLMGHNPALLRACQNAALLTCDGFPLYYYARARGLPATGRVTGRGIVAALLAQPQRLAQHRLFMVLDSARTVAAAQAWAARNGLSDVLECYVPDYGFETRPADCASLAQRISQHGTTLLFMGVGAPRSEIFLDQYRQDLPPCWALCIGQALLVAFGLLPQPPRLVLACNLEWLWRIAMEPRRLLRRYVVSAAGFAWAVLKDMTRRG